MSLACATESNIKSNRKRYAACFVRFDVDIDVPLIARPSQRKIIISNYIATSHSQEYGIKASISVKNSGGL
jgi:hypothetical protein